MRDRLKVCPADTAAGGSVFLTADLGSVGALTGAGILVGTESVQSLDIENWKCEKRGCWG